MAFFLRTLNFLSKVCIFFTFCNSYFIFVLQLLMFSVISPTFQWNFKFYGILPNFLSSVIQSSENKPLYSLCLMLFSFLLALTKERFCFTFLAYTDEGAFWLLKVVYSTSSLFLSLCNSVLLISKRILL